MEKLCETRCAGPEDYGAAVAEALDAIGAAEVLAGADNVLLKPNLVNASGPPVTTSALFCEAVIGYVRRADRAGRVRILVAEGTGALGRETHEIFAALGYDAMAARAGVELVDLNHEPLVSVSHPENRVFPAMWLPKIAFTHYVISLPTLKAHSLAAVTGALKNMMGFAPPKHYGGTGGGWKKAKFHARMQDSILDLVRCRAPDLAVMDASRGLADYHLGGRELSPPPGLVLAGLDAWDVDERACALLGVDLREAEHVRRRPANPGRWPFPKGRGGDGD